MYNVLEGASSDKITSSFQIFIVTLISVNVFMVILETEKAIQQEYSSIFHSFELFSVTVFTAEYAGRILSCKNNPKYRSSRFGIVRFLFSPMMLIDLVAILPFFLPIISMDLRFIRIIRLLRLFRLFKLARYSEPIQTLAEVIKSKSGDLAVAFFILFIVLIFASSLIYHVEHEAQPEAFSSIAGSMWWGVITLTTIGYGDIYPVTDAGKAVAAAVAVLGIAVYAIPTGIMASAFTERLRKKNQQGKCPHCGKTI